MSSVEEILIGRRTVDGCTSEVWKKRREEERRKKAEEAANNISSLMEETSKKVDGLVEKIREVRRLEAQIKQELNEIGRPYLYAKSGLDAENIDIARIGPLVIASDLKLEDFGLPEDTITEVPEDFGG